MEMKQIYLVYIVVHRGQKRDTSDERHAGLLFAPVENGVCIYFHLAPGPDDGYLLELKKGFDPRNSRGALPSVRVGKTAPLTADKLVDAMQSVPIKRKEDEFGDQHWVDGALRLMADAGYITHQAYERGFNSLLQTLLDGSADEVPDLDW
ncbi:hypothetical protein XA68_16060 [Ophiocordyceps unilateralis]|uniref:Uncharacterized protein n=1 Tax=Ophiocordyceps unilateralis TaxID=268505 RepID=A0A2A9P7C0_OPHUN|nr:hypothetical protein XA68_16060 [Ophiocordyceps unilateralis]